MKILLANTPSAHLKSILLDVLSSSSAMSAELIELPLHSSRQHHADVALLCLDATHSPALTIPTYRKWLEQTPLIVISDKLPLSRQEAISLGAQEWLELGDLVRWLPRLLEHLGSRARVSQELDRVHAIVRKHQLHDPLTQLLNRQGLDQALQDPLARRSPLSVALFDIDELKAVNERFGYAVGDMALRAITQSLSQQLRAQDILARVGGDKFMLLMPQTPLLHARQLTEQLRRTLKQQPIELTLQQRTYLTTSVGLVQVPPGILNAAELIALTLLPLNQAKHQGKNRLVMALSHPHGLEPKEHEDANVLQQILSERAALRIATQPIIELDTQQVCGFELLCRGPQGQLQSPDALFGAALEHNLLQAMDLHSIRIALKQAKHMPANMRLSLNIFPSTLINTHPEHLLGLIEDAQLEPSRVCIELNEQQLTEHPAQLGCALKVLQAKGVTLAIDDVGFGKTCLENLLHLSPQFIKIDKGILHKEPQAPRLLERLVRIAHILEAEVVVEGVENQHMLEQARDCGARFAQGFLWGRPALTPYVS